MQYIIAIKARPSACGGDLYRLLNTMRKRVKPLTMRDSSRHFPHSPTRSPSNSVFTSLIKRPAIEPLLVTVAV
jgi:hypothetical protein